MSLVESALTVADGNIQSFNFCSFQLDLYASYIIENRTIEIRILHSFWTTKVWYSI